MSNEDIIRLLDEVYRTRSSISDIWGALTDSEKKLVVKYPFSALKVNTAKNVALEQTELKFGNNGLSKLNITLISRIMGILIIFRQTGR